MPVKFSDIDQAFEFANTNGDMGEFRAFVCRQTGKLYHQTDFDDAAEFNDELPDDATTKRNISRFPTSASLGKPLVPDFAREFLPDDFDDVRHFFSKRGAYPKFRSLLARRGEIERWHAFENEATERALRAWCALHSIDITG